jgi:hypothetical protein
MKEYRAQCFKHLQIMDDTRISKEAFHYTRRSRKDILAIQERDGKPKPEQEDFRCPEVKMMMIMMI